MKFGERGVIEMYRRMAIAALDDTKTANDTEDTWSEAYDGLMAKIEAESAKVRQYG